MERERIITLIVESEPEYAKLVYDMLASSKEIVFEPIVAGSLSEGIDYLATNPPDVILLDPDLPDSYGLDTFMRMQEAAPEVPVVIYSSIGDAAAALSSVKWGAEDYIYRGEATSKLLCRSLSFAVERHQNRQRLRQSEEQFRAQYMGIPVPTYTFRRMNDRFVFVDYNEAARKFNENETSAFAGRTHDEIMSDQPEIQADIARCFQEKTTIKREGPYRSGTTGKELFLATSCVFVPPDLVMVHTEDITERKRIQEALKESEETYRSLVENANEGISVVQDGLIKFINHKNCEMLRYSRRELLSRPFIELVHPDDQEFAIGHYRKTLGGIPVSQFISFRMLDKSGTVSRMLLNTVIITWQERPAVLFFMNDITDYSRKAASFGIVP